MLPSLVVSFGGTLLVVALSGALTYNALERNTEATRMVVHTQEVLGQVRLFQVNYSELVAAVRAYLITGTEEQFALSRQSLEEMNAAIDRLERLTRDNPSQLAILSELRPELVARQAVLDNAIAAYRRGGTAAVQALSKDSAALSRPQRQVDALVRRFEDNESALLQERMQADADGTRRLRTTMALFLLCTVVLFSILFARARRTLIDRDRAEAEMELQRRFLESVVENVPDMLFIKDGKRLAFVGMNRAGEELLGISRAALLGKTDFDFFPREMATQMTDMDREVLETGQLRDIEIEPLQTQRGLRYLHTKKVPIPGEDGKPAFLLGISEDITERRAFENRLLQLNQRLERNSLELESANKELESFSYSVSHDLRAPLRAMDGYAGLLEEDCLEQLDANGRRYLAAVRDSARRMGVLIDDLLTFSRISRQPMLPGHVKTQRLVEQAIVELRAGNPALRAQFRVGTLPDCEGDEALLARVWMNLLENGVKYSSKVREPLVEVHGERRDQAILYTVRDNGVGFDMRYYDKLFSVFQRLHNETEYPGTGVGLATVFRIVSRHNGRVWAESALGQGATFCFSLPITPVTAALAEDSTT